MYRPSVRTLLALLTDALLLSFCVLHTTSLLDRAKPPFTLQQDAGRVILQSIIEPAVCSDLRPGDELLMWNGRRLAFPAQAVFFADNSAAGETVTISYRRGLMEGSTVCTLLPAHNITYVVIVWFVGIVTFALAIFVILARPRDRAASILHWAMVSMAVVVVVAFEGVTPGSRIGYLSSILFFLSYMGVAATFFLLTTMFPMPLPGSFPLKLVGSFLPAGVLITLLLIAHADIVLAGTEIGFARYQFWFDVFHVAIILYVLGGIANFIVSYVRTTSRADRRKLQWVLWGLCLGPTPFLLLVVLPGLLQSGPIVAEEYTLIFLTIIPVSFAISFVKHHLLNVEVVINRTTVYAIVVGAVVGIYVALVGLVGAMMGELQTSFGTGAAVIVALLFEPLRRGVQRFVDRRFFRVRYNFREAERKFLHDMKECVGARQLAELIVRETDRLIPVERIGFFTLAPPGHRLCVLAHKQFEFLERRSIQFEADKLKTQLRRPVALADKMESGLDFESADPEVFHRWGIALVFPLLSATYAFHGFLVLGVKKSGHRFTSEDADLLTNVAAQAALELERIALHRNLLQQEAEAERLRELNSLKSDFVRYVSHELKSPLTNIKMFTELVHQRLQGNVRRVARHLQTIEGETDRLDRMVTTILDATKVEKGMMDYTLAPADLGEIVRHGMKTMQYMLAKKEFAVHVSLPKRPLRVRVDRDAVIQALTNLLSNAMKYSQERKEVHVVVLVEGRHLRCSVKDHGRGISPEALPHLFEKFYRDPVTSRDVQGIGLGLSLVKHIMDGHGGTVEVISTPGKGSTFSLLFPFNKVNDGQKKEDPRRRRRSGHRTRAPRASSI